MAVGFADLLQTEGLTLLTFDEVVNRAITVLKLLPPRMQGELQRFVDVPLIAADKMTLSDMTRLSVACAVSGFLADSVDKETQDQIVQQAFLQSQHIVEVQKKLHAPDHYMVVDALLRHGNLCGRCGMFLEAREAYEEAYSILRQNTQGKSSQLFDLCNAILAGRYYAQGLKINLQWCKDAMLTGIRSARSDDDRITLLSNYVSGLAEFYGGFRRVLTTNLFDSVVAMIRNGLAEYFAIASVKKLDPSFHKSATMAAQYMYVSLWNVGLVSQLDAPIDPNPFIEFFKQMQSSRVKIAAKTAKQFYYELKFRHSSGEEKIKYGITVLDLGLRNNIKIDGPIAIAIDLVHNIVCTYPGDEEHPDVPMQALIDHLIGKDAKLQEAFSFALGVYVAQYGFDLRELSSTMFKYYSAHRQQIQQMARKLRGNKVRRRAKFYVQLLSAMCDLPNA